jgi:4-amino-4-deoxy-L-arabinose transferase-like glycosyltransferase
MKLFRKKNRLKPLPKPKPEKTKAKKARPKKVKRDSWLLRDKAPSKAKKKKVPRSERPKREPRTKKPKTEKRVARKPRTPRPPREPWFPKPAPPESAWGYREIVSLLILAAVCAVLYFSAPGFRSLWETDEARYAEIPREMVVSGDWITPTLNYVKYFEKPPLTYWLVAVSYKMFGVSGGSARLVPALCGFLTVLIVFLLARSQSDYKAGLVSGLILATSLMFFGLSRILMTDMVLCLGVVMALYGAWQTRLGFCHGPYAFWLGCAIGFLSKGLLGPGLPIMATVFFVLATREWGLLAWLANWRAILLFMVLSAPWVILVSWKNPGFFTYFFIDEHFGRLLTTRHQRYEPPWFYFMLLPAAIFPWVTLLPWTLMRSWPGKLWGALENRAWLFCAIWFVSFFVFLTLSSSKMIHYLLPALPALALIMGQALAAAGAQGWRNWASPGLRASLVALSLVILAVGAGLALAPALSPEVSYEQAGLIPLVGSLLASAVALAIFALRARLWSVLASPGMAFLVIVICAALASPLLNDYRSVQDLVSPIKKNIKPSDYLVSYGDYFQGMPFYSGKRVMVVRNWGELDYGRRQLPKKKAWRWFVPNDKEFVRLLQKPKSRVIALAETQAFQRLKQKIKDTPGVLLFQWDILGDKTLFSNRPK